MAAKNYGDTKRFAIRESGKAPEAYFIPANGSATDRSIKALVAPPPAPPPPPPTVTRSADVLSSREEVQPVRRIVVVRNPKQPQVDQGKSINLDELGRSSSLEFSPRITDGRTAVYVIRRPIPPPDEEKPTVRYQPVEEPLKRSPTTLQYTNAPPPSRRVKAPSTPPRSPSLHRSSTQYRSPSPHRSSTRHRSPSPHRSSARHRSPSPNRSSHRHRSPSPRYSSSRRRSPSPVEHHSPTSFYYLKTPAPVEYIDAPSTPPHTATLHRSSIVHPSPSPDRTHTKRRSSSAYHSPTKQHHSPPPQPDPIDRHLSISFYHLKTPEPDEQPVSSPDPQQSPTKQLSLSPESTTYENTRPKRNVFVRTKSTGVQASSPSSGPPLKTEKSIVLVNPDLNTVAVIENPYLTNDTDNPPIKPPRSIKKTRFADEVEETTTTEKRVKKSRWQSCTGCLSRHICLIIVICCTLILIGLAGAAVSVYFLVTNPSTTTPEAVGLAIGAALVIAALCFLCLVLACIGSREGYFSYGGSGYNTGGTAYALIPPSHPKAYLYIPREYMEIVEKSHKSTISQVPMASVPNQGYVQPQQYHQAPPIQQQLQPQPQTQPPPSPPPPPRPPPPPPPQPQEEQLQEQKKKQTSARAVVTYHTINGPSRNNKNMTIEMPEQLITGRKLSPASRERSLITVVKGIGNIVEEAKKRNHGNVPNKVVVKIDPTATETA